VIVAGEFTTEKRLGVFDYLFVSGTAIRALHLPSEFNRSCVVIVLAKLESVRGLRTPDWIGVGSAALPPSLGQ
jgi:hypothetical protein